jgi:adenylate cyclase
LACAASDDGSLRAASRLESLTRSLNCALIASDDLVRQAKSEAGGADTDFQPLVAQAPQSIRGLEQPIAIWTPARAA